MSTIVLIDDDQALVELLGESLALDGHDIIKGYDGETAKDLARNHHPDLMVMDVRMPYGSGLEVLSALRADPSTFDLPVILLTGENSATIYPQIETAPRVVYLKKPIDLEELSSIVRHVLNSYPRVVEPSNTRP